MSEPARHRFAVDDYHRMVEAGVLGPDDRVELIEGEVVEMAPIGSRHAGCVMRLDRFFQRRLGDEAIVCVQNPVRASDLSEPQPDVVLLRPRSDDYTSANPAPAEVLLVIQVADTTAAWDRDVKLPLYATAGVIEAWLVDLPAGLAEAWTEPTVGGYGHMRRVGRGRSVAPLAFPEAALSIDDLLA